MKILPLSLITFGMAITTGLVAVSGAPIFHLSAQDYINIEKQRIEGYEAALKKVHSEYSQLKLMRSKQKNAKTLETIEATIENATPPYGPLILENPDTITPQEQATIGQLAQREQKALKALSDMRLKAQNWAKKHHIKYPENIVRY